MVDPVTGEAGAGVVRGALEITGPAAEMQAVHRKGRFLPHPAVLGDFSLGPCRVRGVRRTLRPRSLGASVLASQQKYLLTVFWFSHAHFWKKRSAHHLCMAVLHFTSAALEQSCFWQGHWTRLLASTEDASGRRK